MGCPYENNSISFFWDGCEVDEADDRALSMIVKDGDTLTLVPSQPTADHRSDAEQLERMPSLDRSAAEAVTQGIDRVRLVSNGVSYPAPLSDNGAWKPNRPDSSKQKRGLRRVWPILQAPEIK